MPPNSPPCPCNHKGPIEEDTYDSYDGGKRNRRATSLKLLFGTWVARKISSRGRTLEFTCPKFTHGARARCDMAQVWRPQLGFNNLGGAPGHNSNTQSDWPAALLGCLPHQAELESWNQCAGAAAP